jgi:DNA polymerase-3 subunit gamma/tau
MIARMRAIATAEGITIDEGALGAIAYRADGGLRDALTMLEQVSAFAGGPVDAATVDAAFGQTGREFAQRLLAAALDGDATAALVAIDDASDAGTDMPGLIRGTIAEFRHLLVARINPDLLARDLSSTDADAALDRARVTPQARLVRGLRLLSDALAAARNSGNARLEIETAMLRFILQHEDPSLDALAARVAALEGAGGKSPSSPALGVKRNEGQPRTRAVRALEDDDAPVPIPPADKPVPGAPESVSAPAALSLQKIAALWQNVSTRAASQKSSLRATLTQTRVSALDGDLLTLTVPDRVRAELLRADLAAVRSAINGVLGRPLEIRIVVENGRVTAAAPGAPDTEPIDLVRYANERLP